MPEHFTKDVIESMRSWTPEAAAVAIDDRVRKIERSSKLTFIEIGLLVDEVDRREYWKHMAGNWHSMDHWLMDAAPVCRTSAYAARKAVRELSPDIPVEQLIEMPRCNVGLLAKVPKQHRKPEIVEAAKTLSEESFSGFVEREVPDAHLEHKRPMRFRPDASQRQVIEDALKLAMEREELVSREDALEAICADYLISGEDVPQEEHA
jgi:hypothetical protein